MTELFFCENGYRVLAVNYSRHKHFVTGFYPAGDYMFKVNKNTRTRREIYSDLTIKTWATASF